jgi:hypothetical protein
LTLKLPIARAKSDPATTGINPAFATMTPNLHIPESIPYGNPQTPAALRRFHKARKKTCCNWGVIAADVARVPRGRGHGNSMIRKNRLRKLAISARRRLSTRCFIDRSCFIAPSRLLIRGALLLQAAY